MSQIAKEGTTRKSILYVLLAALIAVALACVAGSAVRAFAAGEDDAGAPEAKAQEEPQAEAKEIKAQATEEEDQADDETEADDKAAKPKETAEKGAESDDPEPESENGSMNETQEITTQEIATVDVNEVKLVAGGDAGVVTLTTNVDKNKIKITSSDPDAVVVGDLAEVSTGKYAFPITANKIVPADKPVTVTVKNDTEEFVPSISIKVTAEKRLIKIVTNGIYSKATITGVTPKETTYDGEAPSMVTSFFIEMDGSKASFTVSAEGYTDKQGDIPEGSESPAAITVDLVPQQYTISYELDGGKNDSQNPSTYTITDSDITILDPTKDEDLYVFEGWTYEGQTTAEKNPTIKTGSTGNKTFKAKWRNLIDGMTASVSPTSPSIKYDAREHGASDFSLKFTVKKDKSTAKSSTYTILYSKDKKTYSSKESDMTFRDAGTHTLYYKIVDKDKVYKSYKGKVTLTIASFDTVTDDATGVVAKGDIFKKYTTNSEIVQLQVSNLTDSSSDASHIAELKKKYFNSSTMSTFKVYDVGLFLLNRDKDTDKELTSDFGNLALSFPVDSSLNGKAAVVYELHDDGNKVTEIPFKNLKVANGKVSITGVTKLSEFVIVVSKTASSPSNTTKTTSSKGSTTAKTGDTIEPIIPISIATIAVAAIAFAAYRVRKLRQ